MTSEDEKRLTDLFHQGLTDEEIGDIMYYSDTYIKQMRMLLGLYKGKGYKGAHYADNRRRKAKVCG